MDRSMGECVSQVERMAMRNKKARRSGRAFALKMIVVN